MTERIAVAASAQLGALESAVAEASRRWDEAGSTPRLWQRDATLWTDAGEERWLGWLDAPATTLERLGELRSIADDARTAGFRDAVVLGMGGSSLFPDVLSRTFGTPDGAPTLRVLDSTDPAQVRALADALDLERSLFLYASKSGGTVEPAVAQRFFQERLRETGRPPGEHFVAITDPGTALDERAAEERFRATAHGDPTIGGRFSALSPFGIVPALVAGLPARALLERAQEMATACRDEDASRNPGVWLGLVLATAAQAGRDKLTVLTSPTFASFGAWLEQLVAESTGKHGAGIVPVDGETLAAPERYASDRIFVSIGLTGEIDRERETALEALAAQGHPVIRIEVDAREGLGGEVFRWEIATAVACAALGVNAFDQPDVEAAKVAARARLAAHEEGRAADVPEPHVRSGRLALYTNPASRSLAGASDSLSALRAHLAGLGPGDYFAINAFLPMSEDVEAPLQRLRHVVRDRTGAATCLGFGPRFLHSTGQLHKGGPNRGVFLELTWSPPEDLEIPDQKASFAVLESAQALGDFEVLCERDRRALRVHLGDALGPALAELEAAVAEALAHT